MPEYDESKSGEGGGGMGAERQNAHGIERQRRRLRKMIRRRGNTEMRDDVVLGEVRRDTTTQRDTDGYYGEGMKGVREWGRGNWQLAKENPK